ncbi:AraC family transcriptional regulator [Streptomyces ipomoeae]|uniref:helix-turn-helix transcriptional regulator n=1 Tax=Streptomyces ipomoeae TaxID=103232 RepID=UPI0029BDC3B4|nr:AraC family transcriptional regulator [Streptomyces ipomoeae]MDX2826443.1 AraC family transcriptional regulator [Streptomyces ipomoeae]
MRETEIHLGEPPVVAGIGVGVHGVAGRTDVFRLPELWQLHLYQYEAELTVDGTAHTIRPGRVSLVPPGTTVRYRYRGRSEHLFAHLRITPVGPPRIVPVVQDAGAELPALTDLLLQAVAAAPSEPDRTRAELWTTLWRVAHLAAPLTIPEIARAAGVSHNHLTRLFRAETGGTVVGYIRRRRLERAHHLLRATTLSIPAVAASVGIPDLQAFNKACRRELGASPRALRGAAA